MQVAVAGFDISRITMTWVWVLVLAAFMGIDSSECGRHHLQHSAIVTGNIYCDTCPLENFHTTSHFIAGASVEVRCKDVTSRLSFRQQVKTNRHGEFRVHLPPSIGKHLNRIRNCSVVLIRINEPHCAVASAAESSGLHLKWKEQGTRVFSIGFFIFKPVERPEICDQKPSTDQPEDTQTTENAPTEDHAAFPSPPSLLGGVLPPLPGLPPLPPLTHAVFPPPPSLLGGLLPPLPGLPSLPPLPRLPPLPEFPPLPQLPRLPPLPGLLLPPPGKDLAAKTASGATEGEVNTQGIPIPPMRGISSLTPAPVMPQPALPPFPFQPIPGFPQVSSRPKTRSP